MVSWTIIVAVGLLTLAIRSAFTVSDLAASSSRFDNLRRFVPVAALTALCVPSLVPHEGEVAGARAMAGLIAAAVAWRTKNMLAPVIVGMLAFWTIGWLFDGV